MRPQPLLCAMLAESRSRYRLTAAHAIKNARRLRVHPSDSCKTNIKRMNTTEAPDIKQNSYRFILGVVAAAVIFLVAFNWLSDWLNEAYNVNPAIANIANILVPVLTMLFCGVYLLLFRRGGVRTLLGIGLVIAPFAFFTVLQPVFSGDAQVVRWDYRFAGPEEVSDWGDQTPRAPGLDPLADASGQQAIDGSPVNGIDLETTTPYDFPRFLGSDNNATVSGVTLANWDQDLPPLWKQPVGKGWSGFAAVNGFAVTQEQRADQECVTCYIAATGKEVWKYSVKRRHEDTMAMGKPGPRATPTIDQGRVYAMSGTGVLDCLNGRDGSLIWSADVPALVGIKQQLATNSNGLQYTEEDSTMAWGRSTSPLIYKDKVIVPAGALPENHPDYNLKQAATMIAFDKSTGNIVWKGGHRMVAYGSPSVRQVLGRDQILLTAEDHAVGHDPETGEELWAFSRPGGSSSAGNCSQVTWLADDTLLFSKGYAAGGESARISFDETTGNWNATSIRRDPRVLKTKMTSPVLFQDHLYALSDGYLECVRVEGLKRKWKRRPRFGNGQLLLVKDKLVIQSEFGTLHLVQANPDKFVEIHSFPSVKGLCWNTLCLHHDLLIVRSDLEAACYRLPLLDSKQ